VNCTRRCLPEQNFRVGDNTTVTSAYRSIRCSVNWEVLISFGRGGSLRRRKIIVIILTALTVIVAGAGGFAFLVWRGLNEVAHLEPGMVALHLPSGATAYVRRQSFFGRPAVVYLSASEEFCAPYNSSHDFKLPDIINGGAESPLLVSYQGNTVILHGPRQLQRPWLAAPNSFNVRYEELTPEVYAAYVGANRQSLDLPKGWVRVEIPFGHNTCAL